MEIGFSNEKYINEQTDFILKRVSRFQKLYLEFGGKLFGDKHAARVLPGYDEDIKTTLLEKMKDEMEVIVTIHAQDIISNKLNNNTGLTYEKECIRLIERLKKRGIKINSVVINRYKKDENVDRFAALLKGSNMPVYLHETTEGFPNDVDRILSEDGFGKHPYVETTRKIIVVTGPGPGSGKMTTCLSQLYHEYKRGVKAGYAKFETFPVWNLPLKHELNLAYEAATADLSDVNQIDPFHLESYGEVSVNYNRDIEAFPILKKILDRIMGEEFYKSPTDMGVNRIKSGIIDEEVVKEASRQEIIRRYLKALFVFKVTHQNEPEMQRIKRLMEELNLKVEDRKSLVVAREKKEELMSESDFSGNVTAIEIEDGTIITGKDSELMDSAAAAVLNALKHISNIPDDLHLIDKAILEPIKEVKGIIEKKNGPVLNVEEVLICLATSKMFNPSARICIENLAKLRGLRGHSTGMLNITDIDIFRKLDIDLTSDYKDRGEIIKL